MRKLIWPVLFLFLLVLQGALTVFYTGWLSFDLPLVFLYTYTLIYGKYWGALAGLGIGFFQDALTMSIFGFHMLTRTLFAYGMGKVYKNIYKDKNSYHMGCVALGTLAIQGGYCLLELLLSGGQWRALPFLLWQSLGMALGNGLLVLVFLKPTQLLQQWVEAKKINYNLDPKHESAKRE